MVAANPLVHSLPLTGRGTRPFAAGTAGIAAQHAAEFARALASAKVMQPAAVCDGKRGQQARCQV